MTTIAFKDGVLAADRQCTGNQSVFGGMTKVKRVETKTGVILIAACGGSIICREFIDWVTNGMEGSCPEMVRKVVGGDEGETTSAGGFIFYAADRLLTFSAQGVEDMEVIDSYCDGSGGDYARGALAAGASVPEAIEIASRYDINSGVGIDVMWLPGCEPQAEAEAVEQAHDLLARPPDARHLFEWGSPAPGAMPAVGVPIQPLWQPTAGMVSLQDILNAIRAKPQINPDGAHRFP